MSCQNCLAKKCRLSEGNHGQSPPFFTTSDHNWSKGTICDGKDGIAELGARNRVMRWNSADGHKPFPRCDIVRAPMLGYGHGWLPSSDAIMTGCRIVARSQKYSTSFPLSPAPPPERRWCRIYMHLPPSCTKFWCILSALLHRNPLLCFGACLD